MVIVLATSRASATMGCTQLLDYNARPYRYAVTNP